jgi:hypothetical protein
MKHSSAADLIEVSHMPTTTVDNHEQTVQLWRDVADADNPAGPLYLAGEFTEADLTMPANLAYTTLGPSACTASHTLQCC